MVISGRTLIRRHQLNEIKKTTQSIPKKQEKILQLITIIIILIIKVISVIIGATGTISK